MLWLGKLLILVVIAYGTIWNKGYWLRRVTRLDRWVNFNLFNGWKGETVSRRGGRVLMRRDAGFKETHDWTWCLLCKLLDMFERDHCRKAYTNYMNNFHEREPNA